MILNQNQAHAVFPVITICHNRNTTHQNHSIHTQMHKILQNDSNKILITSETFFSMLLEKEIQCQEGIAKQVSVMGKCHTESRSQSI